MRPHPSPAVVEAQAVELETPGAALAALEELARNAPTREARRKAARAAQRARARADRDELDELADVDRAGHRYAHLDARARRRTR